MPQEDVAIVYKGHVYALDSILVDKFCPGDLLAPGTLPLLLQKQRNPVRLTKAALAAFDGCPGDALLQVRPFGLCPSAYTVLSSCHGHTFKQKSEMMRFRN